MEYNPICDLRNMLFPNNRVIRWLLVPPAVLMAVFLPLVIPSWTITRAAIMLCLEVLFVSSVLALVGPKRIAWWATRAAAGCVGTIFLAHFAGELWMSPVSLWPPSHGSKHSAFSAMLGLLVIGVPCGGYALLGRWPFTPGSTGNDPQSLLPLASCEVTLDAERAVLSRPGSFESMRWADLREVVIVTTSEGPFLEDVFFVLRDGTSELVVPQGARGSDALLSRLGQLSGFDDDKVIEAMSCTSDRTFVCWRREGL